MTQGITGTFAFNGTELLLQPTTHKWVDKEPLGVTGEARTVYPGVREYELHWDLVSMEDFSQLVSFFGGIQTSGSVVADLPKYATSPYQFYSYSGCQLREPTIGEFYISYVKDVSLLIMKVRT